LAEVLSPVNWILEGDIKEAMCALLAGNYCIQYPIRLCRSSSNKGTTILVFNFMKLHSNTHTMGFARVSQAGFRTMQISLHSSPL